ncbi:MAG: hypothetical protein EAS51_07645 [Microbacteriaceae bacterium]|nr:MAG: hypothetical protein EAS51_07645 [Microbacteriaceae bacterium]
MTSFRERPGIRVVRVLERDAHTEALLVRLGHEEACPAVLLRALDEFGARARRRELAALDRAAGSGVLRVLDALDDEVAPSALVERLAGPRLAELVAERPGWRAGEVVGVLGPLVAAIDRAHARGVAHGGVSGARVVVTERGPVLDGFVRAELFAPGAPEVVRERLPAVGADRDALRELAGHVLGRVDGARASAARELAREAVAVPGGELLSRLAVGLAELASPTPVDSSPPQPAARSVDASARMLPVVAGEEEGTADGGALAPLRLRIARAGARLAGLSASRRRLLVGGGAALAAASVMLALVPSGVERADAGAEPPNSWTVAPERPDEPPSTGQPVGPLDAAIAGEDPVAAAIALLARRDACVAQLSVLCLEEVDQAGSVALAQDRAAIVALREGAEPVLPAVEPVEPRLIERLGDGAIVRLGPETAPASLLLMRSEAGWRIRDWVAVD